MKAEEVKKLRKAYDRASGYERTTVEAQLDAVANRRRFEGLRISGDDGADRDEAISALVGFGAGSFYEYRYGEGHVVGERSEPRIRDYQSGLRALGIPYDDAERTSGFLRRGEIPPDVLDAIARGVSRVEKLHPDKYPWRASVFDGISDGLAAAGIDTDRVWKEVSRYLMSTHNQGTPRQCIESPTNDALANLFEVYALARYHDIETLDRNEREVRF